MPDGHQDFAEAVVYWIILMYILKNIIDSISERRKKNITTRTNYQKLHFPCKSLKSGFDEVEGFKYWNYGLSGLDWLNFDQKVPPCMKS